MEVQNNNPYFYSQDMNAIYDIYELFKYYNQFFFDGLLQKCTIQWSTKMTLCAGTCQNKGCGSCCIKLSQPLLKFRTPNQLKQTILHQMIHAFLFITNPKACLTEGGHGKQFKQIMNNINQITKLRVTVYHNFTDEVASYRTHVWRCNGICRDQQPFYGYVKRSMNRKPQPADSWWKEHQRYCGGQFIKISQPQKNNTKNNNSKNNKNSKPLKTNTKLEKVQVQQKFLGKGKSLADYAKQMEKKPKKENKPKQEKLEIRNSFGIWEVQQISQIEDRNISNHRFENAIKNEQKKQKSKPKAQKKERESRKITDWFSNKGKTIEELSKQMQEEEMMNSMTFNR